MRATATQTHVHSSSAVSNVENDITQKLGTATVENDIDIKYIVIPEDA